MISKLPRPKTNFLSVHFIIGVQWLGTNCQIKTREMGDLSSFKLAIS